MMHSFGLERFDHLRRLLIDPWNGDDSNTQDCIWVYWFGKYTRSLCGDWYSLGCDFSQMETLYQIHWKKAS